MKKIFTIALLSLTTLVLTGCRSKKTAEETVAGTTPITVEEAAVTTTLQTDTPSTPGEFVVSSCNQYVNAMDCIVEKTDAAIKDQQKKSFEEVLTLWRSLTPDQLVQACDMNMKIMTQQKDLIEKMGCTL